MPSFDIFCLRIFIAFSRLSRTSTSTGLPNAFSIEGTLGTRSTEGRQQAKGPHRGPPRCRPLDEGGLALRLVEERDGQAVELGIGRLRDDLVDDLVVLIGPDPVRDDLAEELALLRLRR